MQIGIIQFPGSNCERETALAIRRVGMEPVDCKSYPEASLPELDGYVIVGGFSYEDRSRAGIIAAHSPIISALKAASEAGKPILGICNGAQILVESGLLIENAQIALAENKRMQKGSVLGTGFYNAWTYMKPAQHTRNNAFTRYLDKPIRCPVAHAEGRFLFSEELKQTIESLGLITLQYCDAEGELSEDFPINPNGSSHNTAAICNVAGNVMAMMPHPERTEVGDAIFASMKAFIEDKHFKPSPVLQPKTKSLVIASILTDNTAFTVENTAGKHGFDMRLQRHTHIEISYDTEDTLEKILNTGLLFNDQKEFIQTKPIPCEKAYLIRPKDNIEGQNLCQQLQHHFGIQGIESIKLGVLWHMTPFHPIESLLFNPISHECYDYE